MSRLPDYAEALERALSSVEALAQVDTVSLDHAGRRVLAEPVIADRDLPPFNRAMMDGYAIRAAEFSPDKSWPVAHVIAAGTSPQVRVPPNQCVAIATGAALPADVDTVIPHEQSDRGEHHGRPVRFTISSITAGSAVHPRGSDAKAGDELIAPGSRLRPQHLGIAAAVGLTTLHVVTRPRVIILTSGDEVVPADTPTASLAAHHVRNSNAVMIAELVQRLGGDVLQSHHLPDDREVTILAVRVAIQQSDLVITIGGVSAGDRDHFPAAFDACGVKRSLEGAAIQPGRPIVIGRSPNDSVIVGLPGNPVSALACSCLFIWPILNRMMKNHAGLPWREVALAEAVKPNPHRRAFRPAMLKEDSHAIVPSWAGSGDLAHTANTHGLLELPVQAEAVAAGTCLRFLPWP